MAQAILCPQCGATVEIPPGFTRSKIRCRCGSYVELAGLPETTPAPRETSRGSSPSAEELALQILREAPQDAPTSSAGDTDTVPTVRPVRPARKATVAPSPMAADPVPARAAVVRPAANPIDTRPQFDVPSGGEPLLRGTTDEDDDQPYAVPGTGLRPCPQCQFQLPLDAVLCVRCGVDLRTGQTANRVKQPMFGQWAEGFTPQRRLQIISVLLVLNTIATFFLILENRKFLGDLSFWISWLIYQLFNVGLQCFLVGSYDTLTVERNAKGRTTITRQRRIAFLPLKPEKVAWKDCTHLSIIGTTQSGLVEWFLFFYLLLCMFVVPGLCFYWFVMRPDRHQVQLLDVYGSSQDVLFRTKNRDEAEDVAHFVADATGLSYRVA